MKGSSRGDQLTPVVVDVKLDKKAQFFHQILRPAVKFYGKYGPRPAKGFLELRKINLLSKFCLMHGLNHQTFYCEICLHCSRVDYIRLLLRQVPMHVISNKSL